MARLGSSLLSRVMLVTMGWMALGAAGCNRVAIKDDVDLLFDFHPLKGPSDRLHSPYVVGAETNLYVDTNDPNEDKVNWTLESSDPTILSVENVRTTLSDTDSNHKVGQFLFARAKALGPGAVTLTVRNGKREVEHRSDLEVRVPTRIDLLAHGFLLIGRHEEEARVEELRILEDGTATYLVRYYDGNDELYGHHALSVKSSSLDVSTSIRQTWVDEDRDWLQVTPKVGGRATLELSAGLFPINDMEVVTVAEQSISEIRILGMDESRAKDDEWLVALAQAYDSIGRAIFGVEYKWSLDGSTATGLGDLYRYQYDKRDTRALEARHNQLETTALIIHGHGYVDSTNRLGCSAAPGGAGRDLASSLLLVSVAALGLAFGRGRRVRFRPSCSPLS